MVSSEIPENKFEIATLHDTKEGIDRDIFLHEYLFVLSSKKPIPKDSIVVHVNGNTMDNSAENLGLYKVNENETIGHEEKDRVFNEHNLEKCRPFLDEHFSDVVRILGL